MKPMNNVRKLASHKGLLVPPDLHLVFFNGKCYSDRGRKIKRGISSNQTFEKINSVCKHYKKIIVFGKHYEKIHSVCTVSKIKKITN